MLVLGARSSISGAAQLCWHAAACMRVRGVLPPRDIINADMPTIICQYADKKPTSLCALELQRLMHKWYAVRRMRQRGLPRLQDGYLEGSRAQKQHTVTQVEELL